MKIVRHSATTLAAICAVFFTRFAYASPPHAVLAENFATPAPDAQAIDIERKLGDAKPDRLTICIDHDQVATLGQGDVVRVYLRPTRTHDIYVVSHGRTDCDTSQVVQGVDIPVETPIWKVGVQQNDTVKVFQEVRR